MRNKFSLVVVALSLIVSNAQAGTKLKCVTKSDEGYYVQRLMILDLSEKAAFVRFYSENDRDWTGDGGAGNLTKRDAKTGWARFSEFNSDDLYGDMSEGAPNLGYFIYVSPQVLLGRDGPISLWAKGSETGLEKATYFCKRSK